MGSVLCLHGLRKVCARVPCGVCMGSMWCVHGFHVVCAWVPCGVCMDSMRCVQGFHAVCAWVPSENSMKVKFFPFCALKQLHLHGSSSLAAPVSTVPTS